MFSADVACLAELIYYEAGNQSIEGKLAVAEVVLKRVRSRRWPNSVCGVAHQRKQFSYYHDGKPEKIKYYKYLLPLAKYIINGTIITNYTKDADHYHADYVNPYWAKNMKVTVVIGAHIFFKAWG